MMRCWFTFVHYMNAGTIFWVFDESLTCFVWTVSMSPSTGYVDLMHLQLFGHPSGRPARNPICVESRCQRTRSGESQRFYGTNVTNNKWVSDISEIKTRQGKKVLCGFKYAICTARNLIVGCTLRCWDFYKILFTAQLVIDALMTFVTRDNGVSTMKSSSCIRTMGSIHLFAHLKQDYLKEHQVVSDPKYGSGWQTRQLGFLRTAAARTKAKSVDLLHIRGSSSEPVHDSHIRICTICRRIKSNVSCVVATISILAQVELLRGVMQLD